MRRRPFASSRVMWILRCLGRKWRWRREEGARHVCMAVMVLSQGSKLVPWSMFFVIIDCGLPHASSKPITAPTRRLGTSPHLRWSTGAPTGGAQGGRGNSGAVGLFGSCLVSSSILLVAFAGLLSGLG